MAYNHGREDRKWRIWKEAEEKLLRECGVDEATIEQIRILVSMRSMICRNGLPQLMRASTLANLISAKAASA